MELSRRELLRLTVPQIARQIGLTRQSVRPTVERLIEDGLVELEPNADHRRSQLVRLTEPGSRRYEALDERQAEWVTGTAHSPRHALPAPWRPSGVRSRA